MEVLKHVKWDFYSYEYRHTFYGIVAIKVEDNLSIKKIHGNDLPACLLYPVLSAVLPEGWIKEAEKLHRSRKNPWLVKRRVGKSGCVDYLLRSLQDKKYLNQPIVACLHVSSYDKLNEGLSMWLGDLPPILTYMLEDYPPPDEDDYTLRVYEPTLEDGWQQPGASSYLQDVLDSLKAIEVIAK